MTMQARILEAAQTFGEMTDVEQGAWAEGCLVEASRAPQILREYGARVMTRHSRCPEDCVMGPQQFIGELRAAGFIVEHENARPLEAIWRNELGERMHRLNAAGRWSSWISLATAIVDAAEIVDDVAAVSSFIKMLTSLGNAWPGIVAEQFGDLVTLDVPDTIGDES